MGEVIRKDAGADSIAADARRTLANAAAKGGIWKTFVADRFEPTVNLLNTIETKLKAAEEVLAPLVADQTSFDIKTDDFLGAKADEMWNMLGRPASDAAYSLIWPGGYSAYAEGSDDEQPDRMEILAELLDARVHPTLDPAWAQATASEVRDKAALYREKVLAVQAANSRVKILTRTRASMARAVQMELVRLKRRYLAQGFTEAEIHEVIPDRPTSKPSKP